MRPSALALGKGDSASQSLPRVCRRTADAKHVKYSMSFSTSRTVLHAATHGHLSVLRPRALMYDVYKGLRVSLFVSYVPLSHPLHRQKP